MPLGSIMGEAPPSIERGTKTSSLVMTAGQGVEEDAPNGWKIGTLDATAKVGVLQEAAGDGITDINVIVKGKAVVKSGGVIGVNKFVKMGANGVWLESDSAALNKAFFAGQHDKPVDGNGKLQDPSTKKPAAIDDFIVIDVGLIA